MSLPAIDKNTFTRYLNNEVTPAEAAAVQSWLLTPANQLVAEYWMREHWDTLDHAPAPTALPEPNYEALLQRLHQQLGFEDEEASAEPLRGGFRWRNWAAAAATVATLAGGALWWQQAHLSPAPAAEYATPYGQTRTIHLPDGSVVTLNAHSTMRYTAPSSQEQPREVWLDGEAYFSVHHQPNNQRFIVHTSAGLQVEVLGTKFTVYRRHEQARVVLLSGKVRVDFADQRPDVLMKPGELVETYDATPTKLVHKPVQPDTYSAWKDDRLVLNETTMEELATRLHDTYGLEVEVATPELRQRRMTGTVPVADLTILLAALEETFHLKAERQENRLILSASPTR
ncbi:FecR family protein [Hymenobacter sp. AT01-02]|uniref:FecR family protein n=1 Tax=Hymenobacter sp. AT01-02 TaxID=1571877 RepID=UPI0006968516|nr:FecR domain-containing protein [Hymenobacter sp. AT01-02]